MSLPSTLPVVWADRDVQNLKALYENRLPPENGRQVFDFIIKNLCGHHEISMRFGEPDATAFNEGRRFVGVKMISMVALSLNQLHEAEKQVATLRKAEAKQSITARTKRQ